MNSNDSSSDSGSVIPSSCSPIEDVAAHIEVWILEHLNIVHAQSHFADDVLCIFLEEPDIYILRLTEFSRKILGRLDCYALTQAC